MNNFLWPVLALFLAGCAAAPTRSPSNPGSETVFTLEQLRHIRVGMTTNQVLDIMPPSLAHNIRKDGSEGWAWSFHASNGTPVTASIVLRQGVVAEVPPMTVPELDQKIKDIEADSTKLAKQAALAAKEEREDYAVNQPGIPQETRNAIWTQRILVGMSAKEVRLSWGAPVRITEHVTAHGTDENWWYPGRATTLEFSKGYLQSWTATRGTE